MHCRHRTFLPLGYILLLAVLLAACAPVGATSPPPAAPLPLVQVTPQSIASPSPPALAAATEAPATGTAPSSTPTATTTASPSPSLPATATASTTPTATSSPTPAVTATATYWPTVTRQVLPRSVAASLPGCAGRTIDEDTLLTVVTQQFGLPATYVPHDLVPLASYLPREVTRDQDIYVRETIVQPLLRLLDEMAGAGLAPSILSGYRSYQEQQLAWHWWSGQYPDRVAIMSAPAGHSEHQLGTTVDFGSPELDHLFHVDFATTAEGEWLAANAPRFGFTQSFTRDAYSITGFKYEPWHYRYVGESLALELQLTGQILTAWQLQNMAPPCVP